jgi:glycosyltransferase 2 family protein
MALGIVSVALVAYALRRIDLAGAWRTLARANVGYLALSLAVTLISIALKTVRWRALFYPRGRSFRFRDLLAALLVGQLGNVLLPARLGDVARIGAVTVRGQVSLGPATLTVVVEKVYDSLALLALLLALSPFVAVRPLEYGVRLAVGAALGLLALTLVFLATRPATIRWLQAAARRLHWDRLASHGERALQAVGGLPALAATGVQMRLWAQTAAIWLLAGIANQLGFLALHLSLPWTAGLALAVAEMAGNNVAYAPAGIGVYHSIAILTLALYGVGADRALGVALLLHLIVYVPIITGGVLAFWREGLTLNRSWGGWRNSPPAALCKGGSGAAKGSGEP